MEKDIRVYKSDWCAGCEEFEPMLKKRWKQDHDGEDIPEIEEYIVCKNEKRCARLVAHLMAKEDLVLSILRYNEDEEGSEEAPTK